jgi:hypothetical protein
VVEIISAPGLALVYGGARGLRLQRLLSAILIVVATIGPAPSFAKRMTLLGDFASGECKRFAADLRKFNSLALDDEVAAEPNLRAPQIDLVDDRIPGGEHRVRAHVLEGDDALPAIVGIRRSYQPVGAPDASSRSISFFSFSKAGVLNQTPLRLSDARLVGEITTGLWQLSTALLARSDDGSSSRVASILERDLFDVEDFAVAKLLAKNRLIFSGVSIGHSLPRGSRWVLLLPAEQFLTPSGVSPGLDHAAYVSCVLRFDL